MKRCCECGADKSIELKAVVVEGVVQPIKNRHKASCAYYIMEEEDIFELRRLAVWRDDRSAHYQQNEFATVNTIVECAKDLVEEFGDYQVYVVHVLTFPLYHGKAFMPMLVRAKHFNIGKWAGNGSVVATYEAAVTAAKKFIRDRQREDEAHYAELVAKNREL